MSSYQKQNKVEETINGDGQVQGSQGTLPQQLVNIVILFDRIFINRRRDCSGKHGNDGQNICAQVGSEEHR